MLKNILLTAVLALSCGSAFAGPDELDQERANQSIQGTVVLRVDTRNGAMSMTQVQEVVQDKQQAHSLVEAEFAAVPREKIQSELDREAGSSSWYWYYPGYQYGYGGGGYGYYGNPYYYNYGNCYNPWYSYSYGYYQYYYYNQFSRYW